MENNVKKSSLTKAIVIHFIIFYAVWAVYELLLIPILDDAITNDVIGKLLKDGVIKNLVWTVPAAILIKHYSSEMHISLKNMFTEKVNWLKYLPVFIAFTAYMLFLILRKGKFEISSEFGIGTLITVLFVGLTEEMVFRGWLLNATVKDEKDWKPIALNMVMFLSIHFPIWIREGLFIPYFASLNFIFLMILSLIFALAFLKSKSIVVPIALHMYWDLLAFMIE